MQHCVAVPHWNPYNPNPFAPNLLIEINASRLDGKDVELRCVTEGWINFIGWPYVVAHTHYSPVATRIVSSNCPVTSRIPRRRASGC